MRSDFVTPLRSNALGTRAMAASSNPLATASAQQIFNKGGSAMDAALTAVIVQGVVDPAMTGIGGDCFCLVAQDGKAVEALNGSGPTPAAARLEDLGEEAITMTNPAAITIPGAVDAWAKLHERYGKLPWTDLFTSAIFYAEQGFAVQERVAHDWQLSIPNLAKSPSAKNVYLRPDGSAPQAGDIWHLPDLARTLKTVANEGPLAFYEGPLAEAMVSHCQSLGGRHTLADFAEYKSEWVTPISTTYQGLDVFECPPNGQGLVALMAFAILEQARLKGYLTSTEPFDPDRVEWQLRAVSAGYEVRETLIADPAHSQGLAEACLRPDHVAKLTDEVRVQMRQSKPLYAAPYSPPHKDTVYVAARDESGLSVSLINSVFNDFGSTHVAGDTGILFHSRGQSFSIDPAHPNVYGPGKRPMHTIIPALALDGDKVDTVFGVMGAHYQPQGQVHVFTGMKDCGLSPQAALDLPRWFANPEGFVEIEPTVPESLAQELKKRLGRVEVTAKPFGSGQIIEVKNGVMIGGTDNRKDGSVIAT